MFQWRVVVEWQSRSVMSSLSACNSEHFKDIFQSNYVVPCYFREIRARIDLANSWSSSDDTSFRMAVIRVFLLLIPKIS